MTILSERRSHLVASAPSRALQALPATAFVMDTGLILVSTIVAVVGRAKLDLFHDPHNIAHDANVVAPFLALGWLLMLGAMGSYRRSVFGEGTDEFKRVLNASLFAAALVGVGCYLMKFSLSRGFFLLAFIVGTVLLLVGRFLLRRALHAARVRGSLLQRAVIAGGRAQIDDVANVLRREKWLGYHLVGALVSGGVAGTETASGIPILGDADSHDDVTGLDDVDVIFFTGGSQRSAADLRKIVWELESHDTQLVMAPAMTDFAAERVRTRPVGGLPMIHMESPRYEFAGRWAKRTFDLMGSGVLILMCAPILIYAALAVKLHDRGPVFFRQTRVGKDAKEFGCFKFRTMVVNAESLVAKLQEEQGVDALLFKMRNDPRITRPGRWLRRFSIDELPQLFNVFLGDMSLVGPRPQVPREVALYDDALRRRLHVRPGMTGLWQVSGRNDLSVEESVRLDLYYVDNWSMTQDLSILARTVGAVVGSKGAY
ncbi:sugar transferase [Nocardioides sp. Kera G14]|uniref:sugar transferase n=1 Tax=Nocardioides sp. Kera G14 TaxID=2884264 RepID=UPI001D12832E|nr:sugar transferase [Nocardioides sp. Kera G14]UDY23088.1 sugar transferase [Nocardioides sp. Kera G14]